VSSLRSKGATRSRQAADGVPTWSGIEESLAETAELFAACQK
jgi:hypothetical protein